MNDLEKNFGTNFFVFILIFLFFALYFPITAQQNVKILERNASVEPPLPFKLCLQNRSNKIIASDFASDNKGNIFIALQSGKVEKINLAKNSILWVSDLGGEIFLNLIFEDAKIYLITKVFSTISENDKENERDRQIKDYILWSIDAETGLTDWQSPFSSNGLVSLDSYQDKIFMITKDGTIISIKKKDGQKIPDNYLAKSISALPTFFENKIYIGTDDNTILTVSADNKVIVSKISTFQSPASILIAAGDKLFWGEKKGFVNLLDTKSNSQIWSVRYGGEISSLTLVPNGILVSSLDNFVYLISPQRGKRVWKRRLAGRILVKPLIVSNFVIFVTSVDSNAIILDLRNGKIVNQISLANIGFILSTPLIAQNLLVFSTNKGIFAFAGASINCPEN